MSLVTSARSALLQRAAALKIAAATEEATIDALLEREVHVEPPTRAECEAFHAQRPEHFRTGTLIEAAHILFAVTDPVPHPALRQRAEALLAALRADDRGFADAARAHSNCPSAQLGGNLGQLTVDDAVPEFWQALIAQSAAGVLPQLVETRFGLHIVRIHRIVPGMALPFDAVHRAIEERIAARRLQQALIDYTHALLHPQDDAHAH